MNDNFVIIRGTLRLVCRTSPITLCGSSPELEIERKYVVFVAFVSSKQIHQVICFILISLSVSMNIPNTHFLRKTMKLLNHNATTVL